MCKLSVAMAAYNGENYIREQILSIMPQLSDFDELIVSYNDSTDNTLAILQELQDEDERIKVFRCEQKGIVSNFENAMRLCVGDIIVLSDQDDIWEENKIRLIRNVFSNPNVSLVLHDAQFVDAELNPIDKTLFEYRGYNTGIVSTIVRNCFQGCCMALRKDVVDKCLPFPKKIPMHDQWIGMIASRCGKIVVIDQKLIKYRIHGNNASPAGLPLKRKILGRLFLVFYYVRWLTKEVV